MALAPEERFIVSESQTKRRIATSLFPRESLESHLRSHLFAPASRPSEYLNGSLNSVCIRCARKSFIEGDEFLRIQIKHDWSKSACHTATSPPQSHHESAASIGIDNAILDVRVASSLPQQARALYHPRANQALETTAFNVLQVASESASARRRKPHNTLNRSVASGVQGRETMWPVPRPATRRNVPGRAFRDRITSGLRNPARNADEKLPCPLPFALV